MTSTLITIKKLRAELYEKLKGNPDFMAYAALGKIISCYDGHDAEVEANPRPQIKRIPVVRRKYGKRDRKCPNAMRDAARGLMIKLGRPVTSNEIFEEFKKYGYNAKDIKNPYMSLYDEFKYHRNLKAWWRKDVPLPQPSLEEPWRVKLGQIKEALEARPNN